jgi:hypothetical protein
MFPREPDERGGPSKIRQASSKSNMDVCFVCSPVTRNAIGWSANFSSLPSPGVRMTGLAIMMLSCGWALCRSRQAPQHDPVGHAGREIGAKILQNISE